MLQPSHISRSASAWILRGGGLLALAFFLVPSTAMGESCRVLDISEVGFERLSSLENDLELAWVELESELLVCGQTAQLDRSTQGFRTIREIEVSAVDLVLVRGYRAKHPDGAPLAKGGRLAIVERWADLYSELPTGHGHTEVIEVPWNQILARRAENSERASRGAPDGGSNPQIDALVEQVDGPRWLSDVVTLSGWDRKSTRTQIKLARDWIRDRFDELPGMSVELDPFQYNSWSLHNVIGTLTGSSRPEEIYIVGGHYDSTGGSFSPGAEDNASGCAGVLEMARIFSSIPPPVTMVFVCYSGEEQGLHGSYHQAGELQASGDDDRVVHMLNMDMIGYTRDADLDCLLETEDEFEYLLAPYADAAAAYTTLRIVTTLDAFGSDHVPFIQAGMPALLTIQNDWNQYPDYHSPNDTADNVNLEMGYQTLRMNVAALAGMIGLDGSIFRDGFESGTIGAW